MFREELDIFYFRWFYDRIAHGYERSFQDKFFKLTQAFYNLLLNAIAHSGDDKRVLVRQTVKGNAVRIEVIDCGDGIKKSDLPYIWDRYYKVDKKHKRPVMGAGLGLSIVKKIVEMHGG